MGDIVFEIYDRVPPEKRDEFKAALHECVFLMDVHAVALEYGISLSYEEAGEILRVITQLGLNRHKWG